MILTYVIVTIEADVIALTENIGKFHLPHIWDEVLFNTSELKIQVRP